MSVQNALEFINRVIDDDALYMTLKSVPPGDLGALRSVAEDAGFRFEAAHWEEAVSYRQDQSAELDDEALDVVAGGTLSSTQMSIMMPAALRSFSTNPLGKSVCKQCKQCTKIAAPLPNFRF